MKLFHLIYGTAIWNAKDSSHWKKCWKNVFGHSYHSNKTKTHLDAALILSIFTTSQNLLLPVKPNVNKYNLKAFLSESDRKIIDLELNSAKIQPKLYAIHITSVNCYSYIKN